MRMKKHHIILAAVSALALTACGSEIPEMSDQQAEIITEYAAVQILDNVPYAGSRLVDTSQPFDPLHMTKYERDKLGIDINDYLPDPTPTPEPPVDTGDDASEEVTSDNGSSGGSEEAQVPEVTLSASQVMDLPEFNIVMTGYGISDSYPEAGDYAGMFFAMDATPGNKLIVARIKAENNSGGPAVLNTVSRTDLHYRMIINGEQQQNTLVTLLADDFSALNETVEAGQSYEGVLICQVSEELASSISSLSVEVRGDEGSAVITDGGF